MSAPCTSRENAARLRKEGAAGADVLDLLELQALKGYYTLPPKDAANLQPWEASKKVLELKLTEHVCYGLDLVEYIKGLAAIGSPTSTPRQSLYAVLVVANAQEPERAPLRIACTVHIGGMLTGEAENTANCYELIEYAVELFDHRREQHYPACKEFSFLFQGESFYFTVAALTEEKSLLTVFNAGGCKRMEAVV